LESVVVELPTRCAECGSDCDSSDFDNGLHNHGDSSDTESELEGVVVEQSASEPTAPALETPAPTTTTTTAPVVKRTPINGDRPWYAFDADYYKYLSALIEVAVACMMKGKDGYTFVKVDMKKPFMRRGDGGDLQCKLVNELHYGPQNGSKYWQRDWKIWEKLGKGSDFLNAFRAHQVRLLNLATPLYLVDETWIGRDVVIDPSRKIPCTIKIYRRVPFCDMRICHRMNRIPGLTNLLKATPSTEAPPALAPPALAPPAETYATSTTMLAVPEPPSAGLPYPPLSTPPSGMVWTNWSGQWVLMQLPTPVLPTPPSGTVWANWSGQWVPMQLSA